jgi:SAM-dependent methyltransferase
MNQWDKLAHILSAPETIEQISPGYAENTLNAWPSVLNIIEKEFKAPEKLKALDIGCGAGHFLNKLRALGFGVTGLDISEVMGDLAKQRLSKKVALFAGGLDSIQSPRVYDLVTSVMVFHFIEDIEAMLSRIDYVLKPFGLLVFAVFNPLFIADQLGKDSVFKQFDSMEKPGRGTMELAEGVGIPLFTRSIAEYTRMLQNVGYQRVAMDCPPFTEDFCEDYSLDYPSLNPELLIMGFRKMALASFSSNKTSNYGLRF